jgi:Ni,Fe-hydrogenase I large subunit
MAHGNIPTPSPNYTGPVVVDPVTRLEGHLRIEVELEGGKIKNAHSVMSLFRGLEIILRGRDPQDAQHITQRTCGVCTYTHALASIRSVDNAVGAVLPPAAVAIRNLVLAAHFLHDHIVHFYHLHALDFVDVTNCLNADPAKAAQAINDHSKRQVRPEDLKAVQERIRKFVESGQVGPFTGAYFLGGHPAYRLSPELDLAATAHYLEALHLQVKTSRACAIFGGKHPHPQFTVVGGVTCYDALRPERIKEFEALVQETIDFVNNVYIPDLLLVASQYKDVAGYGGTTNFLAGPEFCKDPNNYDSGFHAPGIILNRDLSTVHPFELPHISEHVRHSWYEGAEARHPYQGESQPRFTDLHGEDRYSWGKAPRYKGLPMETGPLATVLVEFAKGNPAYVPIVESVLKTLGVGPEALFSTLGRTAARGIETAVLAGQIMGWLQELKEIIAKANGKPQIVADWEMPNEAEGVGIVNAPRGMLSHWIRIEKRKIGNYQLVVPSTWNLGPRCAEGHVGPVEEALIGTPVEDASRPVEVLRTIHSFDPCLACAVHVIDPVTNEKREFKVL